MASLVIYGTELEELDDEKSGISNKRPLKVEEQVVTDERGRRRFHGAFTGGFSAGYFNTVGSKEGWEPKQFRSSRDERGGRIDYKPEDFMDEEDLGEFGIAARQMKTSIEAGESGTEKHLLAWERSTQSSLGSSLSARLEKLIKPTSDSMGVRMLKKMGWREGQGIGSKMSRKALERQKLNEDRASCKKGIYDEEAVKEADEMAPNFQFAPADVDPVISKSYEGLHGLGYRGIQQTSVLSEKYGSVEVALKTRKKGRGISGQAFGVGAFEDDDVNIYTNYDFSQYDFSIGGGAESSSAPSSSDTSFVMAVKRQPARQFFEPPRLPPNFCPVHTPVFPDISQMPTSIKQFGEKMNHVQRAKFLGEVDPKVVFELIHDKDRGRLTASGSLTKNNDVLKTAFEEEPMKQARFKQYINYLKRGLNFPKPADMGTLEWEQELNDFQNKLPPELRSLLPEVQMRQIPLARIDVAAPIANILKSKFTPSSSSSSSKMRELKGDERLAAVKMKMFGEKTRACHEWHPAKQLAKRFNVPDPYPSSTLLGVPHLQRANKTETLANLGANVTVLGSTAQELEYRAGVERKEPEGKRENLKDEKQEEKSTTETIEKPSEDFLKAIFGDSDVDYDTTDDEDEPVAANDDDQEKAMEPTTSKDLYGGNVGIKQPAASVQKVVTVMDISLEEENGNKEFGPAPPPTLSLLADNPEPYFIRKKERRKEHKHSTSKKRKKEKKEKHKNKEKHKKRSAHHQKSSRSGSRSRSSTGTISID